MTNCEGGLDARNAQVTVISGDQHVQQTACDHKFGGDCTLVGIVRYGIRLSSGSHSVLEVLCRWASRWPGFGGLYPVGCREVGVQIKAVILIRVKVHKSVVVKSGIDGKLVIGLVWIPLPR